MCNKNNEHKLIFFITRVTMSSHVLITGGAGFIGSFLVDALVEKGHRVRILDNLIPQVHPNGKPAYLNSRAEFLYGSITDPDMVRKAITDIDIVIHAAAAVGIAQSNYA